MSVQLIDTVFPADSVEFCPHQDAQDIFVCGTYKLDEPVPIEGEAFEIPAEGFPTENVKQTQHRQGKCLVFQVTPTVEGMVCQQTQVISLPAILDMKWCHNNEATAPVLGIADSEGRVTLHKWQGKQKKLNLIEVVECASSDILCLSLDWSNRRSPSDGLGSLVVSLSNGTLCLLRPNNTGGLSITDNWVAHDYEPWTTAWNYWDTNVIFSGGDDLKMKGWDIRQGFSQPVFVNKRFDAGVTTIQSHPFIEHIIAVGSYDNTVRIFDTRKPLIPLTQVDVSGGAWRVKWHPSATRKEDLLVACMHDGFKIVKFGFDEFLDDNTLVGDCEIIKRFDAHQSLAYGVDWSFAHSPEETLIGSCSFYDHALHIWSG